MDCPRLTYPERIERIVRAWPQWSRAERARMEDVVAEVLDHARAGTGNAFIRRWCQFNLTPAALEN
jgi:hypothetical protein